VKVLYGDTNILPLGTIEINAVYRCLSSNNTLDLFTA